ncbi:MAG: indole-3-glycerol phosphate synthase TrpC [Verrucomicrobiota bacterium]|jgi:indole-3-glycerol phosphate synthase|nr:indole-3-glycerol phosphate synthase TrpC [Verrucomicrobiota bacterium]MDI9384107.1 indole-3-glycerol phosphate synthase TrpC [Verrucomicrobiota bacterium]
MSVLNTILDNTRSELIQAKQVRPLAELRAIAAEQPPARGFARALRRESGSAPVHLISEVKRASPSAGRIRDDFDPARIAAAYARAGAHAISVLTDRRFFEGSLEFLPQIRAVVDLPVLRKDFMVDPYQIWEARAYGADAILLIVAALSKEALRELHGLALSLGMDALVEVHDGAELETALEVITPRVLGVNNRNLKTMQVRLETALELRSGIPDGVVAVAESGIHTHADVRRLETAGFDAMLVGESLMRQSDLEAAVRTLLTGGA